MLNSGGLLALTAPLVIDQNVIVGYAVAPEEAYCVDLPVNEFITLCPSLYRGHMTTVAFHGLKRTWEFLDDRGLYADMEMHNYLDIHNIADIKLLADLLDPDSAKSQGDNDTEQPREVGLTLAHLALLDVARIAPGLLSAEVDEDIMVDRGAYGEVR